MKNELPINQIICGDALEVLKTFPDNCIDTIITDPPYGLQFMGKEWDSFGTDLQKYQGWIKQWAKEALRIAKPGATLLCFGGTRTWHRLACAIEDAGWVIKDTLMWIYSQGFPKSLNIEKSLQKKNKCGNMEAYEETQSNTSTDEKKTSRTEGKESNTKYYLRLVREADLQKTINSKEAKGEILQQGLSEQSISKQGKEASIHFSDREGQSSVERRVDIQATERELQRCKICALSQRIFINGEERWLCNGTPFGYGTTSWQSTPTNRSCPSYRPQSEQQQNRELDAISEQYDAQEIRKWKGWGTALKPAWEPIIMAMKPLDGTFANNALKWGVAGLNIDEGRIEHSEPLKLTNRNLDSIYTSFAKKVGGIAGYKKPTNIASASPQGRFPANVILECICDEVIEGKHTNPECPCYMLDKQSGISKSIRSRRGVQCKRYSAGIEWERATEETNTVRGHNDLVGASRFFYVAKASRSERNMGCEDLPDKIGGGMKGTEDQTLLTGSGNIRNNQVKNNHPTVKPLKLMEYLCILTKTPTGGVVLDPFAGSGTTGMACKKTGRSYILIEKDPDYVEIAKRRIDATMGSLF